MDPKIRNLMLSVVAGIILWLLAVFVVGKALGIIFFMLGIVVVGLAGGNVMNTPEPPHK